MSKLRHRAKSVLNAVARWLTQLRVNYEFLFIRRCLAFFIDAAILLAFSLAVAFVNFFAGYNVLLPETAKIVLPSYFLLSRFISNGRTIGMRTFRLHFAFEVMQFRRVRLLYRFLLSVALLLLPVEFIPIVEYLLPNGFSKFHLTLLSFGMLSSIPIYSFLMIMFSNGSASLVDRLSKCQISSRSTPSDGLTTKARGQFIRRHVGGFLLLGSLICFLLLLINWRLELQKVFSDRTFAHAQLNPIERTGLTPVFQRFSKTGYPVFSLITKRSDYLIPYPTEEKHDMLEVLLYIPERQFDNKELHQRIVSEVEITRRLYNHLFRANIYQSRLTLRRTGVFGSFIFTSEYKYIIAPTQDRKIVFIGDIPAKVKNQILENLSLHKLNGLWYDSLWFTAPYPGFFEAKPEKQFIVEFSSGLMPSVFGSGFAFLISPDGSLAMRED